jgi:hypothetical protein
VQDADDKAYDQSGFDTPVDAVPTCQRCGAVIDGGTSCDDCDPFRH